MGAASAAYSHGSDRVHRLWYLRSTHPSDHPQTTSRPRHPGCQLWGRLRRDCKRKPVPTKQHNGLRLVCLPPRSTGHNADATSEAASSVTSHPTMLVLAEAALGPIRTGVSLFLMFLNPRTSDTIRHLNVRLMPRARLPMPTPCLLPPLAPCAQLHRPG